MSKLAHSNQETMDEIEVHRAIMNDDDDLIPADIQDRYSEIIAKARVQRQRCRSGVVPPKPLPFATWHLPPRTKGGERL